MSKITRVGICILLIACFLPFALAQEDCMPPQPTYTPDMPEFHVEEGGLHYGQGAYKEAVISYLRAIELDSGHMRGYYGLAMAYRALGRLDLAIENYSAVIALEPEYAQPYASRAKIYQFLGRYDEAEADLNRYVELYGQYPVAYIERGDFYLAEGEYQLAAEDYTLALSKKPAQSVLVQLYIKRASAHVQLGHGDEATADLRAALEIALAQ